MEFELKLAINKEMSNGEIWFVTGPKHNPENTLPPPAYGRNVIFSTGEYLYRLSETYKAAARSLQDDARIGVIRGIRPEE